MGESSSVSLAWAAATWGPPIRQPYQILTGTGVIMMPIFHLRKLSPKDVEQLGPWQCRSGACVRTHGTRVSPQWKANCSVCWVSARHGVAGLCQTGTGSVRVLAWSAGWGSCSLCSHRIRVWARPLQHFGRGSRPRLLNSSYSDLPSRNQ